jgi:hypothetical protein
MRATVPRLVPNPIGELHKPLQRIEGAVLGLADKLRPVDSLPSVHEELIEVNRTLHLVLESLDGIRDDLASFQAAQLAATAVVVPAVPAVKPRAARARAAG